jgi:hypothetical protein
MIRFIIEHDTCNLTTDYRHKELQTIDIDIPELEKILSPGGIGDGWSLSRLVGVEVIKGE